VVLLPVQLHLQVLHDAVLHSLASQLADLMVQVSDLSLERFLLRIKNRGVLLDQLQVMLFLPLQLGLQLAIQVGISSLPADL